MIKKDKDAMVVEILLDYRYHTIQKYKYQVDKSIDAKRSGI